MPNQMHNRVFYGVYQAGVCQPSTDDGNITEIHGLQNVGTNASFSLDNVNEIGQTETYEIIENVPTIELTTEKVLDGYPPVYILATKTATAPTLASRANVAGDAGLFLSIFDEGDEYAVSGANPQSEVFVSGAQVASVSYTIPVDGNMTESVSFTAKSQKWVKNGVFRFTGAFTNADSPQAIACSGGVQRRENLLFNYAGRPASADAAFRSSTGFTNGAGGLVDPNGGIVCPSGTVLPGVEGGRVWGITSSGTNFLDQAFRARVQNITVSTSFNRTDQFELGRRLKYNQYANLPVEVTCGIEVVSTSGNMVDITEEGTVDALCGGGYASCSSGGNLANQTIKIATCDGTRLNLRYKNKLSSVSEDGGGADGGVRTITYNYTNFNALTVTHYNDPNTDHSKSGSNVHAWLNWYMFDQSTTPPLS